MMPTNIAFSIDSSDLVESWSGYALNRPLENSNAIVMPTVDLSGNAIVSTNFGVIRFWYSPSWSTTELGPGNYAYLLDLVTLDASVSWSLYVSPDGSNIILNASVGSSATNCLTADISFDSGAWYLLTLQYSPSNSALYINQSLTATGVGLPPFNASQAGFVIGSDPFGANPAQGQFEELVTFSQPLSPVLQAQYYNTVSSTAILGPVSSEEILARRPIMAASRMAAFASSFTPTPIGCATGGQIYITNLFCTPTTNNLGLTVQFDLAGGTSNVVYDILTTTNLTPLNATNSTWVWIGQGLTCNTYMFYNQPDKLSYYVVAPARSSTVVAWGDDSDGQCDVPLGLSNVVAVAGGYDFSLALKSDGTVVAWGDNTYGQTNVPSTATNIVAISANWYDALVLRGDGTAIHWGASTYTVPSYATNLINVAMGYDYDFALQANGILLAWGQPSFRTNILSGLTNITAIGAGTDYKAALSKNGQLSLWGNAFYGETNVPAGSSNVVAMAAGYFHVLALNKNGTISAWGDNADGQTNVPSGLSNVVAITAGEAHSVALKRDGSIAVWGDFGEGGPCFTPQGLMKATSIGSGGNHALAICTGLNTPVITEEPQNQISPSGQNVTFFAKGQALFGVTYQWQFNGTNILGATNANLMLTNVQVVNNGNYDVVVSSSFGSQTSSNATFTQLTLPTIQSLTPAAGTTNLITNTIELSVAATAPATNYYQLHYQWLFNGSPIAGATNNHVFISPSYTPYWQTNAIDGNYAVQVTNSQGIVQSGTLALKYLSIPPPGAVAGWGSDADGESNFPFMTNGQYIAAGEYHSVVALDNGTVVAWGDNTYGQTNVPAGLSNVVSVAAGYEHSLALKGDGTVVAWGNTNSPADTVPTNIIGVSAIAAGWNHNVALLTNGNITAWGLNGAIFGWHLTEVPANATNIIAISAQALHSLALKADGTIVAWGDNSEGETNIPAGLSNVVAIAAGGMHNLALKADGTVTAWGDNSYGQTNVPLGLSNVISVAAGWAHSVALKNDGTVVVWGDNSAGQTNLPYAISNQYPNLKRISAGGDHTLALVFTPAVLYYPLDVSHDMLLIYNTNSMDSETVLNYYLQNRPFVSKANILGIGFSGFYVTNATFYGLPSYPGVYNTNATVYETISSIDYTNLILGPLKTWLSNNPTKRPGYIVLMLDVPTRVDDSATTANNFPFYCCGEYPSLDHIIKGTFNGWQPAITHINMYGTNDCIAYINKIKFFGTNYSPGKLIVSASAGGYNNTTYCLDDGSNVHYENYGSFCIQPLTNNGVALTNIFYGPTSTNLVDITSATNVTGYWGWGTHGHVSYFTFPIDGTTMVFHGDSSWYLMTTGESYNGQRYFDYQFQTSYLMWFSSNAFGGTNYSNTPVGATAHVNEPGSPQTGLSIFFPMWAIGKPFANCASTAAPGSQIVSIGDPFVTK